MVYGTRNTNCRKLSVMAMKIPNERKQSEFVEW